MITRTFHPVGQGAFYTEKHRYPARKYNIVYDCGSTSLKKLELERRIKSVFSKGDEIDVLFISHFHADHINGLEFLKEHCVVKNVVVPFLTERSKIALKIENKAAYDNGSEFDTIIDNTAEYFPQSSVITIRTYDEGNNEGGTIELETLQKYRNAEISSSSRIIIDNWVYVPFNFKHTERCLQFENELRHIGLSLNDLSSIERITANKAIIKKAFENIDGELNENSMILYSGPLNPHPDRYKIKFQANSFQRGYNDQYVSCVYTGDFDARSSANVKALNDFIRRSHGPVGTMQIPHHGSIKNYSDSLLEPQLYHCIISVGNVNPYSHPSHEVIEALIHKGFQYNIVTEDLQTMVMQLIYVA